MFIEVFTHSTKNYFKDYNLKIRHNIYGPSFIKKRGPKEYWINGCLHNELGPARYWWVTGSEYYLDGKRYARHYWLKTINKKQH